LKQDEENREQQNKIRTLQDEKTAEKNKVNDLEEEKKTNNRKLNELENKKQELTQENKDLTDQVKQAQEALTKEIQSKRVGNLLALGVFASDYLPLPEK
jgi:seryl-tRNA synthetase